MGVSIMNDRDAHGQKGDEDSVRNQGIMLIAG